MFNNRLSHQLDWWQWQMERSLGIKRALARLMVSFLELFIPMNGESGDKNGKND